jgi:hypothetical protein
MGSPYEKGPRKLNPVSILIIGGLAFGGYAAFRYLPPYWTSWDVKEKLRNACSAMYQMRLYNDATRNAEMAKLQTKTENDIRALGIDDENLSVEIDGSDPNWAVASADYDVMVTLFKPKPMHFHVEAKMDMTPATNDKKK